MEGLREADALSGKAGHALDDATRLSHESAHFLRTALWTSGCVCRNALLRIAYIEKAIESTRNFNERAQRTLGLKGEGGVVRARVAQLQRDLIIARENLMGSRRLNLVKAHRRFVGWFRATGKTVAELLEGTTEKGWLGGGWGVDHGWREKYGSKKYPKGICFSDLLLGDQLLVYQRLLNDSGAAQISMGTYSQSMGEAGMLLELYTMGILTYEAAFESSSQVVNVIAGAANPDAGCIAPVSVASLASALQRVEPGKPLTSLAAQGIIGSVVTGGLFGAPGAHKSDAVFELVLSSLRLSVPKVFLENDFDGIVLPRSSPMALFLMPKDLREP